MFQLLTPIKSKKLHQEPFFILINSMKHCSAALSIQTQLKIVDYGTFRYNIPQVALRINYTTPPF
jgi:hypothetical protein